jgi:hypothetical protein
LFFPFVVANRSVAEMKSSKSTQTVQKPVSTSSAIGIFGSLGGHDPLASAAERIVEALRGVESRIVKSFEGTSHKDNVLPLGGATVAPMTDETLDRYVRYRVAAVTSAALREAEAAIVEELVRISQLVPHGREGYTYPRAQIAKVSLQSSHGVGEEVPAEPTAVERPVPPTPPGDIQKFSTESFLASGRPGLDVLKVAQHSQRRRQMLDFEELDGVGDADLDILHSADIVSTPPRMQHKDAAAAARETHHSRMVSLAALHQTLQQPPGIADFDDVDQFSGTYRYPSMQPAKGSFPQHQQYGALRSVRAQTYANVLQRAMLTD